MNHEMYFRRGRSSPGSTTFSRMSSLLRLGARELDKNGEIMKDSLPAYKNLRQKALTPALDEINEKSAFSFKMATEYRNDVSA